MKEFDLEAAKKGAPVQTLEGMPARIVCWDLVGTKNYPLLVLVKNKYGVEIPFLYSLDGKPQGWEDDNGNLVMAPVKRTKYMLVFKGEKGSFSASGVTKWRRLASSVTFDTKERAEQVLEDCSDKDEIAIAELTWED